MAATPLAQVREVDARFQFRPLNRMNLINRMNRYLYGILVRFLKGKKGDVGFGPPRCRP